jgi:hypothetical protein
MSTQTIVLTIPIESNILEEIKDYSKEENVLMLELGSHAIQKMKQELNQEDREKIKEELENMYKEKVNEWRILYNHEKERITEIEEKNIIMRSEVKMNEVIWKTHFEKEYYEKIRELEKGNDNCIQAEKEKIRREIEEKTEKEKEIMYHSIEDLKEQLQNTRETNIKLEEEKKYNEMNMENAIQTKVFVENKKYDEKIEYLQKMIEQLKEESLQKEKSILSLKEKNAEEVCEMLKQTIEEKNMIIEQINNRSCAKKIGDIGEDIFEEYANNAFDDLDYFKIIKTADKVHAGDFHLHFNNMVIMVDSKKYTSNVNSKSQNVNKIKSDLKLYPYIKIAWIISLDTDIVNIQNVKYPEQMNFVPIFEEGICVIYVNSLVMQNDPIKTLKTIWYISTILYETVLNNNANTESIELSKYKQNEIRVKGLVEFILGTLREHTTMLDKCKEHISMIKQKLKELMNEEVKNIIVDDKKMVIDFLKKNIEHCVGSKISSLALLKQFWSSGKEEEPNIEKRINHDKFKTLLSSIDIFEAENVIQKTPKSQMEINNYRLIPIISAENKIEIKLNI